MKPEVPILMITLQIPVVPEISADEVLDAIGKQVSDAIDSVRQQQAEQATALEAVPAIEVDEEFKASLVRETVEPHTSDTEPDLLAALGYPVQA